MKAMRTTGKPAQEETYEYVYRMITTPAAPAEPDTITITMTVDQAMDLRYIAYRLGGSSSPRRTMNEIANKMAVLNVPLIEKNIYADIYLGQAKE